MLRLPVTFTFVCAVGCGSAPSTTLPVAILTCPEQVAIGEEFELNGDQSIGPFQSTTITVDPAGVTETALTTRIAVHQPGIFTAKLVVSDGVNSAEANCRIIVGSGDPNEVYLGGKFALVAEDRGHISGFGLDPADQCTSTLLITLVDMQQRGNEVTMTQEVCRVGFAPVNLTMLGQQQYAIDDDTLDLLPPVGPITFTLDASMRGAPFVAPGGASSTIGADMSTDPLGDLPTSEHDDAARDDDNDGQNGVTITGNGGDGTESVAFRFTQRALRGTMVSSNEVTGAELGDYMVETELSLLELGGLIAPAYEPMPSTFTMRRIDGLNGALDVRAADGSITCDDVRAFEAEITALYTRPAPVATCP